MILDMFNIGFSFYRGLIMKDKSKGLPEVAKKAKSGTLENAESSDECLVTYFVDLMQHMVNGSRGFVNIGNCLCGFIYKQQNSNING